MKRQSLAEAIQEGFAPQNEAKEGALVAETFTNEGEDNTKPEEQGKEGDELTNEGEDNTKPEEQGKEGDELTNEGKKKKAKKEGEDEDDDEDDINEVMSQIKEGDDKDCYLKEMKDMKPAEKRAYLKKKKEEGALEDEIDMKF